MRADHLLEDWLEKHADTYREKNVGIDFTIDTMDQEVFEKVLAVKKVEGLTEQALEALIRQFQIPCPNCKKFDWTAVRKFNLLFPVHLGIVEGDQDLAYLRGETAQGMFINFRNVLDSTRVRLPFGIAQLGKSFRNEITPGNSVFRTLEFEQGEIEYFFDPESSDWEQLFENWKNQMWDFATNTLGIKGDHLRWRMHTDEERSFYSKRTEDMEYQFPFGFKELWGLAYRTDYDLTQHIKFSGKDLYVVDPQTGKKIVPHVIEPAVGINRLFLMVLCDAYVEEDPSTGSGHGKRIVLKIHPRLAPVKAAVFPLVANKPEIVEKARGVYAGLKQSIDGFVLFDDRGNIGKRYLAQDEVGTPFCVTIDHQTMEDDTLTVRHRDSTNQERVAIEKLPKYLSSYLK
jgi:glycyl-tRNA synthetase